MDGMKILASGFKTKEKDEIRKLVTAMGGVLQTEASSDISFVIVKNVLAAKYKWALNNLKKPIVSERWLHQCWKEHRVVSHESYRTLPFSGLTICVTQVPLDERKEIEKLVQQNGGKYSGDLTKRITHLVCDTPDGDKYKVAKKWGHTHIVTRAWFNQSIARRACMNEELYPVQKTSVTSTTSQMTSSKVVRNSECEPHQEISCDGMVDADLESWLHQCWKEHRVVSHESYRTLPFSGLTISVTQLSLDERKKIEMLVQQNGGKYSADLTKKSTHLVCDAPEGDKYKVAKKWGHVHIVTRAWFNQSVARRACLNEESYPVSNKSQDKKSSVFVCRLFRFSSTFPDIQRDEVVYWIHEGGGEVADFWNERYANYIVEAHGVLYRPTQFPGVTNVSSHWIRSCLQDGRLLDVNSHILFSPLQCEIPLPGFTGIRLCVSQYEEKDRKLLRNLCYFIGGKFVENLTAKVKYLVCKFAEGPKYEAACQCGIQTVTIEWIWECVKQNKVVATSQFQPKEATVSEREAGMCTTSQHLTQTITIPSNSKSTRRQTENSKKQPTRKWLDLSPDLMLNILQRLDVVDRLQNAEKVCTAWRQICKDPALWRIIYMNSSSYSGKMDTYWKMCKHAVDRSQGQLLDLSTYGYPCAEVLEYVAQRSSPLRRLEVKVCYGDMCGVWSEAFKNLPLLEELSLAGSYLSPKDIEVAGRYCPLLKILKVNSKPYK